MSYREGGGYGHGGWHSEIPPAQIGNTIIDPDEFPHVAHLLQNTHISNPSHPGSASNSTGYPENNARHIFVGPNGAYHYTSDAPVSTAPYTGYNYIQAPEGTAPHAFSGVGRNPAEAGYHGTGYFENSYAPAPTSPLASPTYASTYNYPPYTSLRYPQGAPTYIPQSPAPTLPGYPAPPPSVSSSGASNGRPDSLALVNRSFSYDDARLHDTIRNTYQQFNQQYMQGYEGRERYDVGPDGYAVLDNESDHHESERDRRGRRRSNSFYNYPDYVVPAGTLPRASKTPSHAESVPTRRPATATIHQSSRPPNSRHSSSENGDEGAYRHSGRYDKADYNPVRPKSAKSRPNSFSYNRNDPRPIDSDPSFNRYDTTDPRSSSGSLGDRYALTAGGRDGRYYRDTSYGGPGAIVHTGGRSGRGTRDPMRSQPLVDPGYAYYTPPNDFEERQRRARSKSRARPKTPGPSDKSSSEYEAPYRISVRTSPSPPRRGKSRRRGDSPSPQRFRSKSRARSMARPEIHQQRQDLGSDNAAWTNNTTGPSRAKTPMPDGGNSRNSLQGPEDILRAREVEREREMAEYERKEREYEEWQQQEARAREKDDREKKHRHKSRHRERESESANSEPGEREKGRDKDREHRERKRDREREKEKEKERKENKEVRETSRDDTSSTKEEAAKPVVTDPALANPMVENLNPKRERAGHQPGQTFFRPDLICAMKSIGLCIAEHDPNDDHAHNQLLRLDCGHGHHEDCLRSMIASRERIPMQSVDLEADKLWCERCRNMFGKKAGR